MQTIQQLKAIPDDELLRRLAALLAGSRHAEADLVAHIGEVDARRLYAREATPSMFVYCLERLYLSEHEAYLRIAAARASREHPVILDMLADGRLHLTAVALLAPHLTRESRDALLERATHKTKREVEEILAELAPRPDVQPSIRKLPLGRLVASSAPSHPASAASPPARELSPPPGVVDSQAVPMNRPPELANRESHSITGRPGLRPEQVDSCRLDGLVAALSGAGLTPASDFKVVASAGDAAPADSSGARFALRWAASAKSQNARIEPLSPRRYKVQFTASAELCEKLERLKAWMRASVPDGDLAAVIEAAVTEKLERLEARRFGRAMSPREGSRASCQGNEDVQSANSVPAEEIEPAKPVDTQTPRPAERALARPAQDNVNTLTQVRPRSRHVPAEVRRAVYERDQGRCRYVDSQGRRCTARLFLELHHGIPYAVGGEHSPTNVSLLCQGHNRLMAEVDFGEKAVGENRPPRR